MKKTKPKSCEVCGLDKPLVANRGKSIRRCTDCSILNIQKVKQKYYERNKQHIKERSRHNKIDRLVEWITYFKKKYGKIPFCQCCSKQLTWHGDCKLTAVHFDHRHGGSETIKGSPAKWFFGRRATLENIKIFDSCDFGILCGECNMNLPTRNRGQWLQQAFIYYEKTEASFVN